MDNDERNHTVDTIIKRYTLLLLAVLGAAVLLIPALGVGAASPPPVPDALPGVPALPPALALSSAPVLALTAAPIPLPNPVWRIGVMTDGVYALDYATLAAVGVPITGAALADVRLFWRGQEVALHEIGAGTFDPGDALIFYGEKFHGSRYDEDYTDENVYWLTVDTSTSGRRMATRDVAPTGAPAGVCQVTVVAEKNLRYWARASDNPGTTTTWFWEYVNIAPSTVVTRSYPLVLPAPLTTGQAATLVVELASFNYNDGVNPDHHVRLFFNGAALGDFYWDGKTGHVITTTVPAAVLLAGTNTLRVAYVTDVGPEYIFFDHAELTYRQSPVADGGMFVCTTLTDTTAMYTVTNLPADARLYDVSDPLHPVALVNYTTAFADAAPVGTRYLAEAPRPVTPTLYTPDGDLLAPTTGADEIIIAPRHFFAALQPLVAQRQAQGLRVRLVAVDDISPLFNGGVFHPEAIRAFVTYAHAHWPGPAVHYLFLVGDGNFNFKGYNPATYGAFTPTWIPPYREFADPSQGDVPVDSRFGDVDGDGMPEVFVGRLPAQTAEEVAAYVTKVLAYEAQPPAAWQLHALLVADNGEDYDEGFDSLLERLRTLFPTAITTQTVYMEAYCPPALAPCPAATYAVTQAWNAGAGLLAYSGHGSIHRWAHEPLIFNTDLTALTQTIALPFLLSLDCWDGYWMFPPKYPAVAGRDVRSIGEWVTTVLTETGAIAAYGPAGLAYASHEEMLARAMFTAAFRQGVFNLGALTQIGREAIRDSYEARTYTLLGDPALSLPWWLRLRITPATLTLQAGQVITLAQSLASEGDTRFGQTFPVTLPWTVDVGTVDAYGIYTAPAAPLTPIAVPLIGHLGPLSASVTLTLVGPPVAITVSPDPVILSPEDGVTFSATFVDAWGNAVVSTAPVAWESDIGSINTQGIFTAPATMGSGWVTATARVTTPAPVTITGRAHVYVLADAPNAAVIRPDTAWLHVAESLRFTATLVDAWGNPVDMEATTEWQTDAGVVDARGVFTAAIYPTLGYVTATLSFWQENELHTWAASAPVTVVAGPPVRLTVLPDPVQLQVKETVQMAATPYDAWDNPTALTATVLWSSDVGVIDARGLFTAPAEPASGWITATLPLSVGTNTILLTGVATVEVKVGAYIIYLPWVLRQ
ncbi:MAG TPA: C25 family cysteine peptidase [Anaerolineae bacterium]|nr:C25 family cysteine peptidase [Anaerolineae bacterium]HQH38415.1 C25 family cysteine peptidase [Anaerolineae bacterium]